MPYFSIIVPVYNRVDEVDDLLGSLSQQTSKDFEVILVEDGSSERCEAVVAKYEDKVDVKYFYKENEGRSIARNYGMERASGEYFLFFDSDCVIPERYVATLRDALRSGYTDCFGGPDAAHDSFTDMQKAINYSMTSFLTTGGIRGGKVQLEKFVPRTFNMGFSRKVWEKVGGFREMFSEDIECIRISQAAQQFEVVLSPDVCFRNVAHHALYALSRFLEIGAYASGCVRHWGRDDGFAFAVVVVVVDYAVGCISTGGVCLCFVLYEKPENIAAFHSDERCAAWRLWLRIH